MSANGYFIEFINSRAFQAGATEKALMHQGTTIVQKLLPGSEIHWAGSIRKGTAIMSSDLDWCLRSPTPVSIKQRSSLRVALEEHLKRPATILSHVIRLPAQHHTRKVDIAFANATFGNRPLPNTVPFHDQSGRQQATRALKLWTRSGGLPRIRGWALETLVIGLDTPANKLSGLELFLRMVAWFETTNPQAIESLLRPAAVPTWKPEWSKGLPGTLVALSNHARALKRRKPEPATWKRMADVEAWLCG